MVVGLAFALESLALDKSDLNRHYRDPDPVRQKKGKELFQNWLILLMINHISLFQSVFSVLHCHIPKCRMQVCQWIDWIRVS